MSKQEKYIIQWQIDKLKKRKEQLIDEFIGACNEINYQIKDLKDKMKDSKK